MFEQIFKIKIFIFLFIGLFSFAEEGELYEFVLEDGTIEIYVSENRAVPVQSNDEEMSEELDKNPYLFCEAPMHESIKLVVMKQLNKSCEEIDQEDLQRIWGLTLSYVQLERIGPEDFSGLDNLTHVNFYNNHLQYVHPDSFKNLKNLHHLNLSNNLIREVNENLLNLWIRRAFNNIT